MKRFIKEKRGFTLVEILAVIVLISLIVIIAVPSVKSVSAKSKRKLFDTKVKITEEAVNLWGESNLSCFETGCDVLSDCQDIENNTRKCKTTFGLLAKNNIINYDAEVDGVEYVVNPIDSSNMNDYEIFVFLNNNNNIITSELNKDSIKDPEIIDIISNKNNNNIGNDSDKDATSNKVSTSNKKVINITIKYHNNNDDIEYFTNDINATVDLSKIKSKAIKNGYSFYQWSVTYGTASISGDALKVTNDDVTVEAQYKQNSVITINSNGGTYSGSTTKNTTVGTTIDIGSASKTGYTFTGWKVTNGTANISGNKVTPNSSNVTVQAQYKQNSVIKIDLNGGTYSGSTTRNTTVGTTIDIGSASKTGYTFTGWKVTNGTANISGNKVTPNSSNVTVQAQYKSNVPAMVNFATDSWATIAANVQAKKEATASVYSVGSEKEVSIDGTNYTVRIANNSNYDCKLDSKTACGFVVEFVDIVKKSVMNTTDTIYGGWPETLVYRYLKDDFFELLPPDLQSVIVDTVVISGYGLGRYNSKRNDRNWETIDKLYLFTTGEIYSDCLIRNNCSDNASFKIGGGTTTRQLDYYSSKEVTLTNYNPAVKLYNGEKTEWWFRSALIGTYGDGSNFVSFAYSYYNGFWTSCCDPTMSMGISPAFRIG